MKTVTYRGADDPRDPTTRYVTADGKFRLPVDVAVKDVPDDVARELESTEGHTFDIGDGEPRTASAKARELAEEEGIALDSIEGDGLISVDDVRAAIQARDNQPADAAAN
jgi:pyruvate/2-oxoglutarate dehydrogenase complex dihydrolipoamide acyltransferase (E2) component